MMRIPEWRSPQTGSILIERLMLLALAPASIAVWAGIAWAARLIREALS